MPAGGREKMRYIVNSREMNLYDSRTIEEFHMPQAVLMERAAFSFVETLRREKRNTSRTLVVCGSGNNGGSNSSNGSDDGVVDADYEVVDN